MVQRKASRTKIEALGFDAIVFSLACTMRGVRINFVGSRSKEGNLYHSSPRSSMLDSGFAEPGRLPQMLPQRAFQLRLQELITRIIQFLWNDALACEQHLVGHFTEC